MRNVEPHLTTLGKAILLFTGPEKLPGACQNHVTFRKMRRNTYCPAMALILFAVWILFFLSRLEVLV
ncbi:MAG: hypothetical protein TH68_06005 [Candidatus Synechococcus spongiarum 142]|uniref:Uncharacterized protein n=1 Tax=Candidatus Synechococcus spongiarum 142 TaxID=1608213 RepID=A0A6N3X858_9SYNE|nr:MAG: hypothetical protein TH68_06005 [Candidatus Synechococcus spongiarum 142]